MKIGIDGRLYYQTGVGRYIRNLVNELARIDKKNEYVIFLRKNDFDKVELPSTRWQKRIAEARWHTPQEQLIMPYLFNKEKLDLVHFPYQNFTPCFFYYGKFVVTIHDITIADTDTGLASTFPPPIPYLKKKLFLANLKLTLKKSSWIITVSQTIKDELVTRFSVDREKIVVTYEAGELRCNRSLNLREKYGRFWLYVGSAHPHKNLRLLMEAWQKLDREDTKLVLVGDDDYFYPRLKKETEKMGLGGKIIFTGAIADDNLGGYYQEAKALVFPSLKEGFGLPLVEAMGAGCLVIASDIPVCREICQDAALYFDPGKKQSLVDMFKKIIEPQNELSLRQLREKGKQRARQFSWTEMTRKTLQVYENC